MVTAEPTGEVIGGRYVLERRLGRGGVGEVYLANDTQLNRWVAIKRLHADTKEAARRAEMAIQEAKSLASLQHPNIVTLYDFVREGDEVSVVMEFVQGRTLESIASNAPLVFDDFIQVARQALEGLGAAHALGMIHRDIKPSNLMIADLPGGKFQVKVLDFGLAKVISEPSLQTVDQSGSLLGSIYTMAPEQLEHRALDQRTDLYSLGCVLYYALTTRNPFEGETIAAVITAHLQHRFDPLAPMRSDIPPEVCDWVERLFSREIEHRPASAEAASEELNALVGPAHKSTGNISSTPSATTSNRSLQGSGKPVLAAPPPSPSKKATNSGGLPIPLIAAGAGTLLVLAGVAFFFLQPPAPEAKESSLPGVAPKTLPKAETNPLPQDPGTSPEDPQVLKLSPQQRAEFLAALGEAVVVNGTIGRFGENKTGTIRFLNFMGTQRGDLSLVFFVDDNPEEFSQANLESYIGRKVTVQGTISEYNGTPQIEVRSLNQIRTD